MKWFSDFWKWFKSGWKCRPYVDPDDKGGGIVCKKEWDDPELAEKPGEIHP